MRALISLPALVAGIAASSWIAAGTLEDALDHHRAGRIDEALAVYREVAGQDTTDDPAGSATARNNICLILMNRGEYREALDECEEALRLRRGIEDDVRLARTLNNLGLVQQHLGSFAASEASFREALALNEKNGDLQGQAINEANLGVLATQAGWYSRALAYHEHVLELARAHGDEEWAAEQSRLARINRAVVLERIGAYREALDEYRGVLDERERMSPEREAALLVNVGVVYRNLGDPVRAAEAFEDAVARYEGLGDPAALANAFLNLGLVRHLNLDEPVAAERAYRRALELAERSGDRSEEIQSLDALGRLLLDEARIEEAAGTFRRCLAASEESGSSEGRWVSHEGLARVARRRGDPQAALGSLRAAIAEIESVRESLDRSELRSEYFGEKRRVYAAAVEVLADLAKAEPHAAHAEAALTLVQQAKARALLDALGSPARRGAPLDSATLAEVVGKRWLLEYFVGESELLLWIVHDGRIELRRLGDPRPVLDEVARVHGALSRGDEPAATSLAALSATLLPDELPDDARLLIAPDGRLHYLPFELLTATGGARPLLDVVTASYLPSGSALGWLRRDAVESALVLVGFAGSVVAAEGTPAALLASRFGLSALPAADDELAAVRRRLPGEASLRVGAEATEQSFRREVSRGARVVHLISHTVIDERPRRGAAILLAPDAESDGLLYPREIAGLTLPVDLTVLAACSTALGSAGDGDALATLTGAFLAAGSSAVLATLWDVGDAETSGFMEQFYFQLERGLEPAAALRRAKQRLVQDPDWGRSTVWAAYVLVGDSPPVVPRRIGLGWLAAGLGLAAAAGIGWVRLRRSAKRTGSLQKSPDLLQ